MLKIQTTAKRQQRRQKISWRRILGVCAHVRACVTSIFKRCGQGQPRPTRVQIMIKASMIAAYCKSIWSPNIPPPLMATTGATYLQCTTYVFGFEIQATGRRIFVVYLLLQTDDPRQFDEAESRAQKQRMLLQHCQWCQHCLGLQSSVGTSM